MLHMKGKSGWTTGIFHFTCPSSFDGMHTRYYLWKYPLEADLPFTCYFMDLPDFWPML